MKRAIVFWATAVSAVAGGALHAANGGYENGVDSAVDAARGYGDYATATAQPSAAEARTQRYAQCKKLLSLDLSKVADIGDAAFAYSAMSSLTIPANVASVGYISFGGCTNLESVTVKSWNWATATANLAAKEPFRGCTKLKTLVVEDAASAPPTVDLAEVFPSVTTVLCPAASASDWQAAYPKIKVVDISEPEPDPVAETVLYETIAGAAPSAASVYDGYLADANGDVAGSIQLKLGKANVRTGLATARATVQLGAKKLTLKAAENGKVAISADGPTSISLVGGEACSLRIGEFGLSGRYGAYVVDGARNFFASKNKDEQAAANTELSALPGALNVVWDGGVASVSIARKGKAKASVTLAGGATATANTQLLIGEEWYCIPVVATRKMDLAFALWLPRAGGQMVVDGLGEGAVLGRAGALREGAKFRIDKSDGLWSQIAGTALTDYLPDGVSVDTGARWVVAGGARAGKVAYERGTTVVDTAKLGANPSALKLTYKAKGGSFKGSFKVYADVNGRLKATKVSVVGVVLDGVGHGTATIKNHGGVKVTIE